MADLPPPVGRTASTSRPATAAATAGSCPGRRPGNPSRSRASSSIESMGQRNERPQLEDQGVSLARRIAREMILTGTGRRRTDDGHRTAHAPPQAERGRVMSFVSRGFHGRRRSDADAARVPPGQYVTPDFPVLSAGPTPHRALDQWSFSITGEVDDDRGWTWEEFQALPSEEITVDIHCVTKWSKLDTVWRGVSVDTLLDGVDTSAEYVVQYADGGYTTNVPLEDVTGGKAWVVFEYDGEP